MNDPEASPRIRNRGRVDDDEIFETERPVTGRRRGRRRPRTTRSKGMSTKAALGIGVAICLWIGLRVWAATPRWETVDADRMTAPPGHSANVWFELTKPCEMELTVTEADGIPLSVYWLNESDHQQLDRLLRGQMIPDAEGVVDRMFANTLVEDGQIAAPMTFSLPVGTHYVVFEQYQAEDAPESDLTSITVDYQIRAKPR